MSVKIATVAAVLANVLVVHCQGLAATIVGCGDLNCARGSNNNTDDCLLVDKPFTTIGLSRIPVANSSLDGLSWTEGVTVTDLNKVRTFDRSFYLGTPPDLDLKGTGACAVFFNEVSDLVNFGNPSVGEAVGGCQQALTADCVSALVRRATSIDVTDLETSEVCNKLEASFNANLDTACTAFATSNKWEGLSVKELTGPRSADTITAAENSTSDCWPILPKEYDLTPVSSVIFEGNASVQALNNAFFGITPILTLFYPGNGSLISEAEAHLTCMKTMSPSSARSRTEPGTNGQASGAGVLGRPHIATSLGCLLLLALVAF